MKKILTFICLILSIQALAQDSTQVLNLSDIEITGVRTSSQTPISQKILTKDALEKSYQGQEISFILDKTPSISSQSDGGQPNGYTTFRMRGIDQTRINMTLNGVPLNEPEDQGVYFSNYPNFITNINSLQVQRGVGTSANGTASYGGSLNFEGKSGIDKEASAQVGYGSFNTQRANLSYGSGIDKDKMAFYTGLSGYKSDGYKYHSGGSGFSAFLSGGYYGDKNTIKFTGFTGRSMNQMAWFAVSESDIKIDPRINYNPRGENDDFAQSFGQLQYVRKINRYSTLTTTGYYNRLDGVWGMFVSPTDLLKFKLGSNFYGGMSNYHLETNKLTLNVGVHANLYNRTHGGSIDTTHLYTNMGTKIDYSGYAKIGYTIGKFTIFGDLQLRNVLFSYKGDTTMKPMTWFFVNPKGGVTFNSSKNVNYYFSVGQNHREPTRNDMFGGNDNLTSLKIITPEQVIDYELGSNLSFDKISIQYNLFYMNFRNEITLLGVLGSNGLPLMTNGSKSYRSGIELELNYRLNTHFTLTNTSNYAYCRIQGNGKQYSPLYTPKFITNQGITYTHRRISIGVQAKYNSIGYINADNTLYTPSFTLINTNIGYTYKTYSVQFQLNNITNTRYYTSGYGIGTDRYFFVNAPLSGYITFKISI